MRRLRIPRRLRIRGRVWRILLTPEEPEWCGRKCWGLTDHATRRILIWAGLPRRQLELTFCHELGHALAGVGPPVDVLVEEAIIERMAPALRELLVSGRRWRV